MLRHIKVVLQESSLPLTGSTCTETPCAAGRRAAAKRIKPIIEVQEINAETGMRTFGRIRLHMLQSIFYDELSERIALHKNGLKTAIIRSDRPSEVRSPAMAARHAHWTEKHVCSQGQSPERFAVMFALGRKTSSAPIACCGSALSAASSAVPQTSCLFC
jgi:hypothetical protein